MKEIVIISGKGGTGKTSITAAFAMLGGSDVVVADCDVDAADMHLLLQPDFAIAQDFYSGELAAINPDLCTSCGICEAVCRFDAVKLKHNKFFISKLNCEGCGYCARVCPEKAITNSQQVAGQFYISKIKNGNIMVHARLGIGADNSGKLVARVKKEAREQARQKDASFILVDGSPGIGCPVVSSLSGAGYVVFITEPTISGLHDLKRVHQLVKNFGLKSACIINKSDINPQISSEIMSFLKSEDIVKLSPIPYNEDFSWAMSTGKTIVEFSKSKLTELLSNNWDTIKLLSKN